MAERDVPSPNQEPNPKEAALAKFEALIADQVWHGHPVRRLKFRSTDFLYKGKQALPYDYVQVNEHISIVRPSRISTRTEYLRYLRISEYDGVDSEMRHVALATHYEYDYQTGHLEFRQIVSPDSYVSDEETRKLIEEQPELYPSYRIAEKGYYKNNEKLWEYLNSLADSLAAHSKYTAEATAELQRTMRESREGIDFVGRTQAIAIGLAAARGFNPEQDITPESEPTTGEVINLHRALKEIGVDFEEIDVEHIGAMETDEAIGHLFDALLDAGVEDPEAYLKEKGILE